MHDYSIELAFAKKMALEAGALMRRNFGLGMKKDWKEDNSPVTVTDHAINQLVIDEVKKSFPTHSVLGEEASHEVADSEYAWLCDPVDGTIPFSHGSPTSVFLLALVKDGVPVLGVIYDPFMDRLLHSVKGHGAFLNDQPINVSSATDIKSTCVELSIPGAPNGKPSMIRYHLTREGAKSLHFGCVGYGEMLTACGEFAGTIFGYKKPYDVAAAKVIIEEAGGKVTDLFGNEQRYDRPINGCVMSNGILHDELVKLTKEEFSYML